MGLGCPLSSSIRTVLPSLIELQDGSLTVPLRPSSTNHMPPFVCLDGLDSGLVDTPPPPPSSQHILTSFVPRSQLHRHWSCPPLPPVP
ncbi:hypothetical protein BO71DRAFT_400843 [Aspergillus ellipticus CBS 707.79]|uniref:Uncharacterized protein n=1 Tax=Aspergillus ellipticus CBS 707.79 TaxID=1448320 RepID=A0A319D474_9EURO|nr:hypothetical protein BO71DRAFT_400843 [Aspergillus ellipticus CBS 707.79]